MLDVKTFRDFWKRRSYLEKRLIIFVLILTIVLLLILLVMIFGKSDETCQSIECVSGAAHILDYIDPTTRPCDDFHQFVCGSFIRKAKEFNKLTAIKLLEEKTKYQIESIITEDPEKTTTNSLKLQRQFYRSCVNNTAIEAEENDTFLTLLDALGGWPALKGNFWDEEAFDWKLAMIKGRKLGFSFQKFIGLDMIYLENKTTTLQILPPDDVDRISDHIREPYVELMRDIAGLLHVPSLGMSSELRHVVGFQNELFAIISKARNATTEGRTLPIFKWQEIFPRISWLQFINNLLSGASVMKESDLISVRSEQYLIDLEMLLLKTGKRLQANYFIWKIVEKFIPFLTSEIRDRYEMFQRQYMNKKTVRKSRRENCIDLSKEVFQFVAEIEYVRRYTTPKAKKIVTSIFDKVKEKLLRRLKLSTRLTTKLSEETERDIRNITINVGGPDITFNVAATEKSLGYDDLAFFDNDLAKMVTKVSINRINHEYSDIGKVFTDESRFLQPHTSVNAFYMDYMNLLILPAPLLQDIFFSDKRPNYMNYGALATTIGHELAHSLGKLGNKTYETRGKYTFVYNEAFYTAFGNSSQCFEDQYKQYCIEKTMNQKVPSTINETLEENIADFVGTDIGYELYQEYVDENGVEPKLPGVDFTPNQIFWIMTATFLCQKPSTEQQGSFHADSIYRINSRLRNLPEFSRDFHCPENSFMNPKERCRIF